LDLWRKPLDYKTPRFSSFLGEISKVSGASHCSFLIPVIQNIPVVVVFNRACLSAGEQGDRFGTEVCAADVQERNKE